MSKLRDGVIKQSGSWSYVIRVPDPANGVTKPKWVGGFDTEEDAKAAAGHPGQPARPRQHPPRRRPRRRPVVAPGPVYRLPNWGDERAGDTCIERMFD